MFSIATSAEPSFAVPMSLNELNAKVLPLGDPLSYMCTASRSMLSN